MYTAQFKCELYNNMQLQLQKNKSCSSVLIVVIQKKKKKKWENMFLICLCVDFKDCANKQTAGTFFFSFTQQKLAWRGCMTFSKNKSKTK